eukprot:Hpha_TRINITY_DN22610_c0_g1::TRINITY_DN22610_c0_g1_i1::g.192771::m.192771
MGGVGVRSGPFVHNCPLLMPDGLTIIDPVFEAGVPASRVGDTRALVDVPDRCRILVGRRVFGVCFDEAGVSVGPGAGLLPLPRLRGVTAPGCVFEGEGMPVLPKVPPGWRAKVAPGWEDIDASGCDATSGNWLRVRRGLVSGVSVACPTGEGGPANPKEDTRSICGNGRLPARRAASAERTPSSPVGRRPPIDIVVLVMVARRERPTPAVGVTNPSVTSAAGGDPMLTDLSECTPDRESVRILSQL